MYKGPEEATYLTGFRNNKKTSFTGPMCGKEKMFEENIVECK